MSGSLGGRSRGVGDEDEGDVWGNRILVPQAIVRNTFVDVVDSNEEGRPGLRRTVSDSDLSRSSGEQSQGDPCMGFWLPSLSSQSSGSDHAVQQMTAENRDTAPWLRSVRPQNGTGNADLRGAPILQSFGAFGALGSVGPGGTGARPLLGRQSPAGIGLPQGLTMQRAQPGASSGAPALEHTAAPQSPPALQDADLLAEQIHAELEGAMPLDKLQELARTGVLASIPRDEAGELASVGSIRHATNECAPCAYWFKGICKYSVACHYCHYLHPGQKSKRLRPSKQTRMRMRKWEAQKQESGSQPAGEETGSELGDGHEIGSLEGQIERL